MSCILIHLSKAFGREQICMQGDIAFIITAVMIQILTAALKCMLVLKRMKEILSVEQLQQKKKNIEGKVPNSLMASY